MRNMLCVTLVLYAITMHAQGRIIMNNNAYIVMKNNVYLVVGNAASNAITTTGTGGNIVSEAEGNYVKWEIGNTIATYVIPFTTATGVKIPFTYQSTTTGTGNGTVSFSTYGCATWDNNAYRPAAVTNMTNDGVANASQFIIDRFWQTVPDGYTVLPDGNLIFTYNDAEHTATGNAITESELRAERYEPVSDGWEVYSPGGACNTTLNTVSGVPFTAASFMTNWTLIDQTAHLLPIVITDFSGACGDGDIALEWTTASEQHTDYFTIRSSVDGNYFYDVTTIPAAGFSSEELNYQIAIDKGYGPYLQLRCTDIDGTVHDYGTIFLPCVADDAFQLSAWDGGYHNLQLQLSGWMQTQVELHVFDLSGRAMIHEQFSTNNDASHFAFNTSTWANGIYLIQINDACGHQTVTRVLLSD